ncbi:Isochorismatase domain-containing protein [Balamuthia mandrillaris]
MQKEESTANPTEKSALDLFVEYFQGEAHPPAQLFQTEVDPKHPFYGLYGRIIKGRNEEELSRLSDSSWKRLSWIVGPDGLADFCRRRSSSAPPSSGRRALDLLLSVGKDKTWLRQKVEQSYSFKLLVFETHPHVSVQHATWEGIFSLMKDVYPESWPLLRAHQERLQQFSFEEIQQKFWEEEENEAFDIEEVHLLGEGDPRYLVEVRLLQRARERMERYAKEEEGERDDEARISLGEARAFLYHEVGLNGLFSGDGYTKMEATGERGMREYLMPFCYVKELPRYVLLDLPLAKTDFGEENVELS